MMDSIKSTLSKYATFTGRATRSEWLTWTVAVVVINLVLGLLVGVTSNSDGMSPLGWVQSLFGLAIMIPSLAVAVRRFHDTGKSGWMVLVNLIPLVGWIIALVMLLQPGQPGTNQYGPNPETGAYVG